MHVATVCSVLSQHEMLSTSCQLIVSLSQRDAIKQLVLGML